MWDAPAETVSLTPSAAELAWRLWLVQAWAAAGEDGITGSEALVRGEGAVGDFAAAGPRLADAV